MAGKIIGGCGGISEVGRVGEEVSLGGEDVLGRGSKTDLGGKEGDELRRNMNGGEVRWWRCVDARDGKRCWTVAAAVVGTAVAMLDLWSGQGEAAVSAAARGCVAADETKSYGR